MSSGARICCYDIDPYGRSAIVMGYLNENVKALHIYVQIFWNKTVYRMGFVWL